MSRKQDSVSKHRPTRIPVIILCAYFGLQIYHVPCWQVLTYGDIVKVLAAFTFLQILKTGKFPINKPVFYFMILYVLGITLAVLYGSEMLGSFSVLSGTYISIVFFIMIHYYFGEWRDIEKILVYIMIVTFAVTLIVLFDTENSSLNYLNAHGIVREIKYKSIFVSEEAGNLSRTTFFNMNANVFADEVGKSLLILAFFWSTNSLCLVKSIRTRRKWFLIAYAILGGMGFLSAGSRGSYVALLISLCAFYLGLKRVSIHRVIRFGLVMAVLILALSICTIYSSHARIAVLRVKGTIEPVKASLFGKVDVRKPAMAMSFSRDDTFTIRLFEAYRSLELYMKSGLMSKLLGHYGRHWDWAISSGNHCGYIYTAVEFGLITFIAVIGLQIYLLRKLLSIRRRYLLYKITSPCFILSILCIALLVSYFVKQLVAPVGSSFLGFMALVCVGVRVCERDLSMIIRSRSLNRTAGESSQEIYPDLQA